MFGNGIPYLCTDILAFLIKQFLPLISKLETVLSIHCIHEQQDATSMLMNNPFACSIRCTAELVDDLVQPNSRARSYHARDMS